MTTRSMGLDLLHDLNRQYQDLTGREAYLYAYSPGDQYGTRYCFTNTKRFGLPSAPAYMKILLAAARQADPTGASRSERET